MLKQVQEMLRHRTVVAVGLLWLLIAGIHQGSRVQKDLGGALLDFEAVCALAGAYIGFSLQRLLRTDHSRVVPKYLQKHLVTAFTAQFLVVALCVAGATGFATNPVAMFGVLWGWSLAWCCAGYLGKISLILTFWLNLLFMSLYYIRFGGSFLSLVQKPFAPSDLIFPVVDGIAIVFMVVWMGRRRREESLRLTWTRKTPQKTSEALEDNPYYLDQRPWPRIRQFGLGLKPDYWPLWLLMIAAALLWGRYQRGGSEFGRIYLCCFMGCYFMLGQGVFTRDRVKTLFPLPVNRHNLIRDYGLTLFLSCARRWCAFVLVAWFAVRIPLPGIEPLAPPRAVWVYCAGILLIIFGLRALVGSWNDRLLFRILAVWLIVLYASFSAEIPMSPVLALFIGLGLITAAYYRWCHVEMP